MMVALRFPKQYDQIFGHGFVNRPQCEDIEPVEYLPQGYSRTGELCRDRESFPNLTATSQQVNIFIFSQHPSRVVVRARVGNG